MRRAWFPALAEAGTEVITNREECQERNKLSVERSIAVYKVRRWEAAGVTEHQGECPAGNSTAGRGGEQAQPGALRSQRPDPGKALGLCPRGRGSVVES